MKRVPKILIVDDEAPNRRLLRSILRHEGCQTDEVASAAEALERLRLEPFDLVYLDVMMPGRDGIDLLREIRATESLRPLPVVLITALNSIEDKVRGLDAGADDFLTKPVDRAELRARTHTLLRVKALHDAEQEARHELEKQNDELLRLQQMKKSLTQMLVHDLKNPLTGILGHADLLLSRSAAGLDPRGRASLGSLRRSAEAMRRMVTDLLDLQLLEEDRLKVRARDVAAAAAVEEILQEFEGEAELESKAVRLDGAAPGAANADPDLLRRVLGNLVTNALKHVPAGEGRVVLRVREEGSSLRFEVADNGPGIPPADRERVFERFAQVSGDLRGRSTDRGLGLTFCRLAVEAMGGEIHVEEEPGGGCKFWLTLPRAAAARATAFAAR